MAEIKDICSKVEDLLKDLGCEFEVCRGYIEGISIDDNVKITVKNPHIKHDMTVEIKKTDGVPEIMLIFEALHDHFELDEFPKLPNTVRAIIENNIGAGEIYQGEERNFFMSANVYRSDVESKPYAECFGSLMSGYVEKQCRKDGAEIRFKFWDPRYDRTVTVDKG